ncbi:hypothetical protein D9M72_636440 [compost metagenome]
MKGLRARGGFEIDIEWKNSKLMKLVVKSSLGGNARIRIAKDIQLKSKTSFTSATEENSNPYYQVNAIKTPLVSDRAELKGYPIPETQVFDFDTEKGQTYIFESK